MIQLRAVDIIMKKRGSALRPHGDELKRDELKFLIDGYVEGKIPDYQVSAWLMAVFFNGMTFAETGVLTDLMLHSGDVIELRGFPGLDGPFVDKHSTGGVGDKISLPLAPIVACCGIQVPMMSGRALGHTGGTLDKLEAIEGYRVGLTPDEFRSGIAQNGFAMTGQTKAIVPADRLLYALRDVTGTVESVSLITASILSKKIAEGSDALVFDVKYGSGAFMHTAPDAEKLAESLVKTAVSMGKKASALITNMNTPLGRKIGNFLELEETIECLQGNWPPDVKELTLALGAQMLILGGKAVTATEGIALCEQAVVSGEALRRFLRNIEAQGGNSERVLAECGKRRSAHKGVVKAEADGFISIDAFKVGLAGVTLGVGRNRTEDAVCPDAGVILRAVSGERVQKGDVIMEVFGKDDACLAPAIDELQKAVSYSGEAPKKEALVYKVIAESI